MTREAGINVVWGFHMTLGRWDTVGFFTTKDFKDSPAEILRVVRLLRETFIPFKLRQPKFHEFLNFQEQFDLCVHSKHSRTYL